MLPAEELTMLEGRDSSGKWAGLSFVAEVTAGAGADTVYFPYIWVDLTLGPAHIDFGDGTSTDLSADVVYGGTGSFSYDSGIFHHTYSAPGTYVITMGPGVARLSWWIESGGVESSLAGGPFGDPLAFNVLAARIPLAYRVSRSGSAFGDFQQLYARSVTTDFAARVGSRLHLPMQKLVHYGYYAMDSDWAPVDAADPSGSVNYGFSGGVEELYLPNLEFDHAAAGAFCLCDSLRVLYVPRLTAVPARFVNADLAQVDIYTGRLSSISPSAFSGESDSAGDTPVHLHVPMTSAEFRALDGWTVYDVPSGTDDYHPWGAGYLRVYATDLVFDTQGNYYEPETGHRVDRNGVWLDGDGRWIDHDGNYVLDDGVTPAMWYDGSIYKVDSQGRRIDDDGHFLDLSGAVVSDCGRPATSDGFFFDTGYGNAVDFYGRTVHACVPVEPDWFSEHPEYNTYRSRLHTISGLGNWYYVVSEEINGETLDAWRFYDTSRHLLFKHYPVPPGGRLVSALVDVGVLVPLWNEYLNVLPYDNVRIRIVGRPEGSWTDPGHSDADETEIPEKFKYPSTDNVPANYGLVTSDVAAYPEDVSRVFRLSFAYVPDPDTGDINPVRDMRAVVQMADSVVMVPCSFGFNSGFEPESGFDITFGNLSVANVQGGYSASDTAVEVTPPSDMDPSSGWPQIRLGSGYRATGYDDYPCGYWITMLEILTDGRVTARYYPYMLNGSVVLKNSLEGAADDDILRPSEGAMGWSGEYAAYNP